MRVELQRVHNLAEEGESKQRNEKNEQPPIRHETPGNIPRSFMWIAK